MIKVLDKIEIQVTYLYIIKAIYRKASANIILKEKSKKQISTL